MTRQHPPQTTHVPCSPHHHPLKNQKRRRRTQPLHVLDHDRRPHIPKAESSHARSRSALTS
jgi:hypothetical protein